MTHENDTVVITGASSGVGLEAAAQLAELGWGTVMLACRSLEKAEATRAALVERVGRDPFEVLAIDTSEVGSARAAAEELARRGSVVDALILNAGASRAKPSFNTDGVEITYASTLVGHHVLTMHLLALGALSERCRIIIAGSEGARGNLPGMSVHDVAQIAAESFAGDKAAAIEAIARVKVQSSFDNMGEYVTAKRVVAWWAASLSRRLPEGMSVNAVSPGSAPSSNFGRDASPAMKLMGAFMKAIGPLFSMAGSIEAAARRYVDAIALEDTGHFYATEHRKKLVGPMARQTWPEALGDRESQEAAFDALVHMTGTVFPDLEAPSRARGSALP